MKRTIKESGGTGFAAPILVFKCPNCEGQDVHAELHPMAKQRHTNAAHHHRLMLRCVGCNARTLVHRGSVNSKTRFRVPRFPRTKAKAASN